MTSYDPTTISNLLIPSGKKLQRILNNNRSQYRNSENENEKLLLDEAEQVYNRIVDAITNNCINWMSHDTESSSQILQVPKTQVGLSSVGGGNRKIFDTRDLSQVNLVYNNITFQVYPGSNITNENVASFLL